MLCGSITTLAYAIAHFVLKLWETLALFGASLQDIYTSQLLQLMRQNEEQAIILLAVILMHRALTDAPLGSLRLTGSLTS